MSETTTQHPLVLLKPMRLPPRKVLGVLQGVKHPANELAFLVADRTGLDVPMALDFETRGDVTAGGYPVGVALSDDRGSWYIDFLSSAHGTYEYIIRQLAAARVPLVAHNLFFDAAWIRRDFPDVQMNWRHCTYALYKLLATEGWAGQRHGLKEAMIDLLKWDNTNEEGIDKWLCENGYGQIKNIKATGAVKYEPQKGEMWRVPATILGQYACLDADATYQMYTKILLPALERFHAFQEYIGPMYMEYIQLLIDQKLSGILIDRDKLTRYRDSLVVRMEERVKDFFAQPEIRQYIDEYNKKIVDVHMAKAPARLKKNGEISKNYLKWEEKLAEIESTDHFNLGSGPQRQWLFYEKLGQVVKEKPDEREPSAIISYKGKTFEVLLTESGQLPTDEKALKQFGQVARPLLDYIETQKELGYVEAVLEHSPKGVLHPSFKVPGTSTGRLAGAGGLNIQQMPGSKEFLECFIARPGYAWVACDHTSLEQVVLAELSQDASLWKLFGPNAKPNDVYLFSGAALPGLGDKIRATGYDPENPTAEAVSKAKKECKHERQVSKAVVLGSSYGMGAGKLQRTLAVQGIEISFIEAKSIQAAYWKLYAGVKKYEAYLMQQWKDNDGWVLNGIGRPVCIAEGYEKDIVNRVVQSTGHDLHIMYIIIVNRLLREAGIPYTGIILDLHDALTVELEVQHAEIAKEIIVRRAYQELARQCGGKIPLKGEAKIVYNWAEDKME
jgi:DNA polymerase I-like protein with 3'-5' exonuclease and polymerase domains